MRLDEDLREALREQAEQRGTSEADIIRQAIVFYLGWLHARDPEGPERPEPAPPDEQ